MFEPVLTLLSCRQGRRQASAFNFGTLPTGCATRVIALGNCAGGLRGFVYTTFINPATSAPFLVGGAHDVINLGSAAVPDLFQVGFCRTRFPQPFTENEWSYRISYKTTNEQH
jgi:hypothetical protein